MTPLPPLGLDLAKLKFNACLIRLTRGSPTPCGRELWGHSARAGVGDGEGRGLAPRAAYPLTSYTSRVHGLCRIRVCGGPSGVRNEP